MADGSTIEWLQRPGTKPATWNPIRALNKFTGKRGWFCTHVHEGCRNCYAERLNVKDGDTGGNGIPYRAQDRELVDIILHDATLLQPLKWKSPRTIFVCSMSDLYGEWVTDEWLDKIKAVQALTPQHTYIELTKRPERMRAYLPRALASPDAGSPSEAPRGLIERLKMFAPPRSISERWRGRSPTSGVSSPAQHRKMPTSSFRSCCRRRLRFVASRWSRCSGRSI
jgi:hypothetical protein